MIPYPNKSKDDQEPNTSLQRPHHKENTSFIYVILNTATDDVYNRIYHRFTETDDLGTVTCHGQKTTNVYFLK